MFACELSLDPVPAPDSALFVVALELIEERVLACLQAI
jgi:hypothetical protein